MILNPILQLRQSLGYTQKELARSLAIREQTVRRAEQGTFTTLPRALMHWGNANLQQLPPNYTDIERAYERWRTLSRQQLAIHEPPIVPELPRPAGALHEHPFESFRTRLMVNAVDAGLVEGGFRRAKSVSGFCKLVHLDPKIVDAFETSYRLDIPAEIDLMLDEIGFQKQPLLELLKQWRKEHGL